MTTAAGPLVALPPIRTFQALHPIDLKVYLFLAALSDPTAHITLPAAEIARALGLSPRRAQYALATLRKHNLLEPAGYGQHAHLRISRYALPCVAPHAQPCTGSPPHAPSCIAPHASPCVDPSFSNAKTAIEPPETANTNQPTPPPDPLHQIAQGLQQLAAKDPNELLGALDALSQFANTMLQQLAAQQQQRATTA